MGKRARPDAMTAAESRKFLAKAPEVFREWGFVPEPTGGLGEWHGYSFRFGCHVRAGLSWQESFSPWVYLKFKREYRYPTLAWDHPANRGTYADIDKAIGCNPYSGKCNLHLWGRMTHAEALDHLRMHLQRTLGDEALQRGPVDTAWESQPVAKLPGGAA